VESAQFSHSISVEGTVKIVRTIKGEEEFPVLAHKVVIAETQARLRDHWRVQDRKKLDETLEPMDNRKRHVIMRAVDEKTSGWLNVLPTPRHQFDLFAVRFQDALVMRYCCPLIRMPTMCDGCGAVFTLSHTLDCKGANNPET